MQETFVQSLGQEDPWRREWLLTSTVLPGKPHRQRSLVGYSPWGCKESDMIEQLITQNQYYALNILRSKVVDFPCGPVIKNLPCDARDRISIPGRGAKILYARKQCAATTEACIFWSPHTTTRQSIHCKKIPHDATETQHKQINK